MIKFEVVDNRVKGFDEVEFVKDFDECRFPSFLKNISSRWYTLLYRNTYIGDIYEHNGYWRAFSGSVENIDGKAESCVQWLINNR